MLRKAFRQTAKRFGEKMQVCLRLKIDTAKIQLVTKNGYKKVFYKNLGDFCNRFNLFCVLADVTEIFDKQQ